MDGVRLDKWLWAARFFKTRSLATDEIDKGRVQVNDQAAKPSREVRVGDRLLVRQGQIPRTVIVRGLSEVRGPAPVAQQLYEETAESIAAREEFARNRRFLADPSQALEHGRPTKRDRRQLADWQRWSASADDVSGKR
ncbi:RNA-binding S4 domain-containing protein [Schlegelella sp. S2-27]|uniref:RNA-binding S4 domain-containing protein n=1 Tax=Caldimonas mangrovi TaxID=2944811 RepID=A0ABT0YPN2_9BURK|nr:RNA-binding S4 domain-containing protein [Caldimonas mangrovi]MCM5679833.1 RNA-binding S4 domain-containing protein [Caldimonas mangrovi]